jgi:hypothetical protein
LLSLRVSYFVGVTFVLSCGGSGETLHDGGPDDFVLAILNPPTDSVGLAFAAQATLRVAYLDDQRVPIAGGRVSFAIEGDAKGSTLGAAQATTDGQGVAQVFVVAGAARTSFRVTAAADHALPATFYVTVSDIGFAALEITPRHVGARTGTTAVELRLYGSDTPCAGLAASGPPPSPFPSRTVADFGATAGYTNLGVTDGYTVLGWARDDAGHVLASGCLDLAAAQIHAGATLYFDLPVADVPAALLPAYLVVSSYDLSSLGSGLVSASSFWKAAGCPLGAAQLLLDCAIDALDGGDALDCSGVGSSGPAQALAAKRAPLDASGCRPVTPGALDDLVQAALTANAGAPAAQLAASRTVLQGLLSTLTVTSQLTPHGTAVDEQLLTAALGAGASPFREDLVATSRPVLLASASLAVGPTTLTVGPAGFTLRLGALLGDGFQARAIAADPTALGTAIVTAAATGGGTGCDVVSQVACSAAGLSDTCLRDACTTAVPALDAGLGRPFSRLTASGTDFARAGSATLIDADHDITAEALGPGSWMAGVKLDDGSAATFSGSWQATAP